ncbi:MAG TPA: DUF3347 domain-containing protein [Chitinophagaceae bacterium]|jgi:hypothetical protein|nr:DUF3347 domain-containing protein [Chitinophagaceae bacterium]HMU59037.1 DUF3347 domain-containing protein [Chitinophagaceae bacterium]
MKKILLAFALTAITFAQTGFAQDSTKAQSSPLLTSYYTLKDALVSSNSTMAAASAESFIKALNDIDKETVKDESRAALLSDASSISQTKDLKVQREKFATLSANMFALAKTVKLSAQPVYQQYCPMKKASWLSDNKAIKNPYYGSAMLTCGSVKETL